MKTSKPGRDLIDQFEANKLVAYKDCVGIWTIGRGHTAAAGAPIPVAGMRITPQESDEIFIRDLEKFEAGVSRAIKRPMTQPQFDAFVSLAFNIGVGAFSKSSVVSRFNRGDVNGAAAAFLMWNKAGGRELAGLTRRRKAEMKLFNTGDVEAARAKVDPEAPAEDMPRSVDKPATPKTMATSKTGNAAILTGATSVGTVIAAAKPVIEGAQAAKDTANDAAGLFGISGSMALLAGALIIMVAGCGFIWWDRRRKLYQDGV